MECLAAGAAFGGRFQLSKNMTTALMDARLAPFRNRGEQKTRGNSARKEPFSDGKALRKNKRKKASILAFF
jgi:hypothetical protein